MSATDPLDWEGNWKPRLAHLCEKLRASTYNSLVQAEIEGDFTRIARPVAQGAGDVTFGLDLPCEEIIDEWIQRTAQTQPLSVLTEDSGWVHMIPDRAQGVREIDSFDHGGARLVIDPIDGTRNLMANLRSAWTVIGYAPPGPAAPRLSDLTAGYVAELPTTLQNYFRVLHARRDGACSAELRRHEQGVRISSRELVADRDARVDHGYFSFFRYTPALRPAQAAVEAEFFARLERHESADLRSVYDDQYISNGGQLMLTALGTYRMLVDARALLGEALGIPYVSTKPYDVAGAIVVARAAGAVVCAADGSELDFPIDTQTPVHFAAFANAATHALLMPHVQAALQAALPQP